MADRLRQGDGQPEERRRFQVQGVLGVGATACVYAAIDHDLGRHVAVKMLVADGSATEDIAAFLDEARITASLAHPNVLPVHELDIDADGRVFFTMKRIDGRSLGDAIETSTPDARAPAIASFNAVVSIAIAVCQALAYAHARRVVHQDVKPANIMLGGYGEVLLVDWGSAADLQTGAKPSVYGTPLYMSPEQARNTHVDERSDIYCVGATLFHALLLRVPTWHDDPDIFWRLKRDGVIEAPTPVERARVPGALLDIALKALAAEPDARYPSIGALLGDLRAYQEGLAVSAHRETAWARLRRWHRRNARALWTTVSVAALVLTLLGALWGERLKELAEWGEPVLVEEFEDDAWQTRWLAKDGSFERRDGRLVTTAIHTSMLILDRRLSGAIAVEYEAELLPGTRPCDLSMVWARDIVRSADRSRVDRLVDEYHLQFGTYDGSYTAIRVPRGDHVACSDAYPRPGVRHRVRIEIEDERIAMWIDGRLECEWFDAVRFDGGYIGLYGFYPDKAFDRVRIFERGVPQQVPVTAIGDAFMRAGDLERAWQQFARVVTSHSASDVGREALYKQGLCRWEQGRQDDALETWRPLLGTDREELVRLHEIERRFAAGDLAGSRHAIEELAGRTTARGRKLLALRWSLCADGVRKSGDQQELAAFVDVFDRLLADEKVADRGAAEAYLALKRYDELIVRFPRQRLWHVRALKDLGRHRQVTLEYPDQMRSCDTSRFEIGLSAEIHPVFNPGLHATGLVKRGRYAEVLERFPTDPHAADARVYALIALGRLEEAMGIARTDIQRAHILVHLGRLDEALATGPGPQVVAMLAAGDTQGALAFGTPRGHHQAVARHLLAIERWIAGDRPSAEAFLAGCHPDSHQYEESYFHESVLFPFLRSLADGDWAAFDAACSAITPDRWRIGQKPWHDQAYLTGAIDEAAYLAQPHAGFADANLLVRRGLRHERRGDHAAAVADYRAWLALPSWRRDVGVDPVMERFCRWRVDQLSAVAPPAAPSDVPAR